MNILSVILISNTVIAALLAFGIALLGRFWKNPAALHLTWIVVLLKLFTPAVVTIDLPIHLNSNLSPIHEPVVRNIGAGPRVASQEQPPTDLLIPSSERRLARQQPESSVTQTHEPFVFTNEIATNFLMAVWICGSIAIGTLYLVRIRRFSIYTRGVVPASQSVQLLAAQLSSRLGIKRVPSVWMTEQVLPPLVWSVGTPPKIILPSQLFERLSLAAQTSVLSHELVHVRRGDYFVRLLETAAMIIFWWNPVVWWACWQLRELEEQCCDSRVLELNPNDVRTYALTLIDTADFLSGQPRIILPLPTPMRSERSLASRIRLLATQQTNRLNTRSAFCVALLISIPLMTTFAADPEKKVGETPDEPKGSVTILRGYVDDEHGNPLTDAVVKVAVPEMDMRFLETKSSIDPRKIPKDLVVLETKTGDRGQFQLKITGIKNPTKVSIDAMKPGYRRLVGMFMRAGDKETVEMLPGAIRDVKLTLKPALYFSGVVVDEHGKPIPNVRTHAMANSIAASGGVEVTVTNHEGKFQLFNYPAERPNLRGETKGVVDFFHSHYLEYTIGDVYELNEDQREALRIVLPSGRKVSGKIIDASGKAVPNVMVKIMKAEDEGRKAILTDAKGNFELRGLHDGESVCTIMAWDINQKARLPLDLREDRSDLEIRLSPIPLAENLKKVEVLGMQLTDLSADLVEAFDFDWKGARGALILNPGSDFARFKIHEIIFPLKIDRQTVCRMGSVSSRTDESRQKEKNIDVDNDAKNRDTRRER